MKKNFLKFVNHAYQYIYITITQAHKKKVSGSVMQTNIFLCILNRILMYFESESVIKNGGLTENFKDNLKKPLKTTFFSDKNFKKKENGFF